MKWNSRAEDAKFENNQKTLETFYRSAGMTEEQIAEMREYDKAEQRRRRNEAGSGFETVPLYRTDAEGNEVPLCHPALTVTEDCCRENPLEFGFCDDRLNRIVALADPVDLQILLFLSRGYGMREMEREIGISHVAVSRRVQAMKKKIS